MEHIGWEVSKWSFEPNMMLNFKAIRGKKYHSSGVIFRDPDILDDCFCVLNTLTKTMREDGRRDRFLDEKQKC